MLINTIQSVRTNSCYFLGSLIRSLHNASSVVKNSNSGFLPLLSSHQNNHWIYQRNENIGLPLKTPSILDQIQDNLKWVPPSPTKEQPVEAPSLPNNNSVKEAARLIIIRRKKMKKHKLRKLRLRMKYVWAKVRQKREWKKEKEFQAGLIAQCKTAETFSAEEYVQQRIKRLNELVAKKEGATNPNVIKGKEHIR